MNRWIAIARVAWVGLLAAVSALSCDGKNNADASAGGRAKIGFVVKQPEEPWFQNEWKFAQQAADAEGFDLIKIGAPDGEKVLSAIDNLAAQGAGGYVICTPDVRLGPAIAAKSRALGLKVMSVDDQFVDAAGKPMAGVPHLGISAREIGKAVGAALVAEMNRRGWSAAETGMAVITFDELDTARERTGGASEAAVAAGLPPGRVFTMPQKTSDVPGALDAANVLLVQHPQVKRWLIAGMNDNAVLGAVRATEGRGVAAADVIGIGINGTDAMDEFRKSTATGFHASVLLAPKQHGYETARMMHAWVKSGVEPPPVTYTSGTLITRETYRQIAKEQGLIE